MRGVRTYVPLSASVKSGTASAMNGEWKAPATLSSRTRTPSSRSAEPGLAQRPALAGEHELAGGVVVGDGDAVGLGEADDRGVVAAERGEHGAVAAAGAGLGHEAAAQGGEAERVALGEGLGDGEGGQLAEGVPGDGDGRLVELGAHGGVAGQGGGEDRGLGEARVLVGAGERVLADDLRDEVEQLGPDLGDAVAHVGRLAALPGEEDGGRHV